MLNSMAVQSVFTLKPSTKWSHIKIIMALITNKNSPNVKNVTGKVSKTKMGFTKKFNKANTIATFKEVSMPFARVTPFIKWEISITSNAVMSNLSNNFMLKYLKCLYKNSL
jgi:hypothetical protein